MEILLSKSSLPILKYIAELLGLLMNGIYELLDKAGAANIGLAMIFFTIVVYVIMTPVQYSTQRSSKIMAALNPEIKKIQKKYAGKRDQYSMQKQQAETQALYAKYGVSMSGSCLPMLIQLPLFFSVYQVILYIPGYIARVRMIFDGLAAKILSVNGAEEIISTFVSDNKMRVRLGDTLTQEKAIDFLYALKPSQWLELQKVSQFASIKSDIAATATQSQHVTSFLGINITEAPVDVIRTGFSSFKAGTADPMLIAAMCVGIAIPVLAWFTQWLNYKLMPQQNTNNNQNMGMLGSMNTIMPIFSAVICVTLNMGIGIYWIMGAVIRCIQQVIINRRLGKIDLEELRARAQAKEAAKNPAPEAYGNRAARRAQQARDGARSSASTASYSDLESPRGGKARTIQNTERYYTEMSNVDPNSITAKANMVRSLDSRAGNKGGNKGGKKK